MKIFSFSILITCLTGCSSWFVEPEEISTFCQKVEIGADFSSVLASLPSLALELREQSPKPDDEIIKTLTNPDSIQTALITAEGLDSSVIDSACLIYFSSILHKGDGKIVDKEFFRDINKGI